MRHRLPSTTRYCCKCRSTTKWDLVKSASNDVYRCVGDDDRHPERHIHGCGTEIQSEKFLSFCSIVAVQK